MVCLFGKKRGFSSSHKRFLQLGNLICTALQCLMHISIFVFLSFQYFMSVTRFIIHFANEIKWYVFLFAAKALLFFLQHTLTYIYVTLRYIYVTIRLHKITNIRTKFAVDIRSVRSASIFLNRFGTIISACFVSLALSSLPCHASTSLISAVLIIWCLLFEPRDNRWCLRSWFLVTSDDFIH